MKFSDIVQATRSCRKFSQGKSVNVKDLLALVNLTRFTASAANSQPLRYKVISTPEDREKLFPSLEWTTVLTDWEGPTEEERATGYIIIMQDMENSKRVWYDPGIAAATITYGATSLGYGSCILASLDRERISRDLEIPEQYAILLVIAIGVRGERVKLEKMKGQDDSTACYRDAEGVHHVPKRALKDILI